MSLDRDPTSWAGRLFGWSLLALLAAMALDGAIGILRGIWVPLTVLAVLGGATALAWARWRRF